MKKTTYIEKLKEDKKFRVVHIIGAVVLFLNLLINLLKSLNHHHHFFNIESNFGEIVYHTLYHPLFTFFEHSWIEIFSAILIYVLLENKIEELTRIPDKTLTEKNQKEILEQIRDNAKEEVRILDLSIYAFTEDMELFKNAMNNALARNVNIMILLLHPDTYAIEQRSKDLNFETKAVLAEMKKGLSRLHEYKLGLKSDGIDRFTVKLFKSTTNRIFTQWDDKAHFGLLHPSRLTEGLDTFYVKANSDLIESFINHFNYIWSDASMENKKLVDLGHYLFVNLVTSNQVIYNLNWGADGTSNELPKFIVDNNYEKSGEELKQKESDEELKQLSDSEELIKIEHDNCLLYCRIRLIDKKVDKDKTRYAKERIDETYGNIYSNKFKGNVFQIEYEHDNQIKLINANLVKEKLDLKGYTFVSHKQYDVTLSPLLKFMFDNIEYIYNNELETDFFDSSAISKIQELQTNYKSTPRKRLMAIYTCNIKNGIIELRPYTNDNIYHSSYKIIHGNEAIYSVRKRRFTTLHKLLDDNIASGNSALIKRYVAMCQFIESGIKSDIMYLHGVNNFISVNKSYKVYAHLIRTEVWNERKTSYPTPQSNLNTQCDFQVIHLIKRENIFGGLNEIIVGKDSKQGFKYLALLESPLDSVFFKKSTKINKETVKVKYHATKIILDTKGKKNQFKNYLNYGCRDVLVFEFIEETPFNKIIGTIKGKITKQL